MVTIDGLRLGKPKDADEGRFHPPSARTHPRGADRTYRARRTAGRTRCNTCTRVTFRDFARDRLAAYLATGEPLDKAGAYGIRATAHCSSRARRATITASWVCSGPLYTILRDI